MKTTLLSIAIIVLLASQAFSQKYVERNGHIWFYSEAPLENIEAHNYQVTSIIDMNTGDIVFSMLMKGFQFEKALMQEHFNEKYVDSDKYPKATFKGKITNIAQVKLVENTPLKVTIEGELTIHGVTKKITAEGTLELKEGVIKAVAKFKITLKDYGIKIPNVVKDNIAETVDINVDVGYDPM